MLTVLLTLRLAAGCLCLPPLIAAHSPSLAPLPGGPLQDRRAVNMCRSHSKLGRQLIK